MKNFQKRLQQDILLNKENLISSHKLLDEKCVYRLIKPKTRNK